MIDSERFLKVAKAALKAELNKGKSVLSCNPQTLDSSWKALAEGRFSGLLGVKDTAAISRDFINGLTANGYVWHTLDKAAAGGRAVDTDLVNPLTGTLMTGSSSGSAINILRGINDLAIATDGGGSVLAPALACNLYSAMLAGCGCKVNSTNVSTDGIVFSAAYGLLARKPDVLMDALRVLDLIDAAAGLPVRILMPAVGSIRLPDGTDMRSRIEQLAAKLLNKVPEIKEIALPDFSGRHAAIAQLRDVLAEDEVLLTFEGPVDVYGMGDSVCGLCGPAAGKRQNQSGKFMVKIANMLNMTAVTLPGGDAAAGLVAAASPGRKAATRLFNLLGWWAGQRCGGQDLPERYLTEGGFSKSLIFS